MRRGYRSYLVIIMLAVLLPLNGCTRFWENDSGKEEVLTMPDTSTVEGALIAQKPEAGRLPEYGMYPSVCLATTAAVRVYVDEREDITLIVAAQGLNPKGERVLAGMNVTGMEYKDGVRRIVERMVEKGFASDLNANVKVETETGNGTETASLRKEAEEAMVEVFKEHGMNAVFNPEERR